MEHPGGNAAGITSLHPEQVPRQLEMVRSLFPNLTRVGVLSDTTIRGGDTGGPAPIDRANDGAARQLGMQPLILKLPDGPSPDLPGWGAGLASCRSRAR